MKIRVKAFLGCAGLLCCAWTAVVRAEPADPGKAQAQVNLREGNALLQQGHPADALAKFTEAYRLFPSPRLRYNIGQAQSQLPGHEAQAYEALSAFLVEAKDANRELREAAETRRDQLRSKVGLVSLAIEPADGELLVDDVSVGKPSQQTPLVLGAGTHRLKVRKDSRVSEPETLTVSGGDRFDVRLRLNPPSVPPRDSQPARVHNGTPMVPANISLSGAGDLASKPRGSTEQNESYRTTRRALGAGLIGLGGASLILGIVEHVRRESKAGDFKQSGCGTGDLSIADCQSQYDQIQAAGTWLIVGYVGAALLGAGGAYLLWFSPPGASGVRDDRAMAVSSSGATVNLRGRF